VSTGARSHDQDLGDILLAARLVDEGALAQARREAQRSGRPLWRLLTRDSLVSEDALFKALRQEVRVPVLAADQLKSVEVPEELRGALPPDVAQHLGILPLERSTQGQRAVLAMVDPTADITPIWPALTKLGIVEVRRFLVHLGTLRLGLEFFYGRPWQPEPDDAVGEAALMQSVQASLARSATTQPIPVPAGLDGSVMVDPGFEAEVAELDGPTDPKRRAVGVEGAMVNEPTGPVSRSAVTPRRPTGSSQSFRPPGSSQSFRPPGSSQSFRPPGSSQSLRPVGPGSSQSLRPVAGNSHPGLSPVSPSNPGTSSSSLPYRVRRESSLPELSIPPSGRMADEQPVGGEARVRVPEGEPVQDAIIKASEALSQGFETELRTGRPEALARLAQGVAERLSFAPRAVRELMLISRMFGLLRLLLLRNGPLPRPSKGSLGFETKHPLMLALRELQTVFVDFIRMPTEPDLLPMGVRIVDAVTAALELADEGFETADIGAKLRLRGCDASIVTALMAALETDLQALGLTPGRPEPLPGGAASPSAVTAPPRSRAPAKALFVGVPRPPLMPDVSWKTTVVSSLSDEGFLPYAPAAPHS
jgi:hypothetical protein